MKNIDTGSHAKSVLVDNTNDPDFRPFFMIATGKRPAEELYDLENDPEQLNNLAAHVDLQHTRSMLRSQLHEQLALREDPRVVVTATFSIDILPIEAEKRLSSMKVVGGSAMGEWIA
ncbi:MAG: hypothetical protein ACR2P1_08520 [Pseudomonadales bacterium]